MPGMSYALMHADFSQETPQGFLIAAAGAVVVIVIALIIYLILEKNKKL